MELALKLGIHHPASTVRRYMVDPDPERSSTWKTFVANHAHEILAIDFTTQVMWNYSVRYVLVVLSLHRRELVHLGVTARPSLDWVKQQLRDAVGWQPVRFVVHDNDGIFGQLGSRRRFRSVLDAWLPTPYGAPNANALLSG